MKNETRNTPVLRYKLVNIGDDTLKVIKTVKLTRQEMSTLNYAYGLNLAPYHYVQL